MFCWLVEWHGCPRYFWFCCLSVDEKNGFAPICSLQTMSQICKNGGVNMGQRWQMPRYLHHPVFWYPYYFFTPPFLQVCDKLARSKFVQIRFQSSVLKTASRHFATPPLVFAMECQLGSDTSSVWNFCTPSSGVFSQGNQCRVFSQAVSLVVVRIKFHWPDHESCNFIILYIPVIILKI